MTYTDIKNTLSQLTDPVMRLEFVMDLGCTLPDAPRGAQCTEIVGCTSRVEICRDGNNFYARADAAMVRGLVAILIAMVDGRNPTQIREMDLAGEFAALNLNLGSGRLSGIDSMIRFLQNL